MFCRMKRKAKTISQKSAFESVIRQIKIVQGLISVVKAKAPPKKKVTTRNLEYGGYSCGKCGKKTFVKGHICDYLPIPKSLELTVCDALSDEMKKVLNDWHEKKNEDFVAWREKTAEENAWFKFAEENIDWFDTSSSGESISDSSQEESIIGDESSVGREWRFGIAYFLALTSCTAAAVCLLKLTGYSYRASLS